MFFHRRSPGGAGVVDENVDGAELLHYADDHRSDGVCLREVVDKAFGVEAAGVELCKRGFELVCLTRGNGDFRSHVAERFGHREPQAARAASNQCNAAREVE